MPSGPLARALAHSLASAKSPASSDKRGLRYRPLNHPAASLDILGTVWAQDGGRNSLGSHAQDPPLPLPG